MPIIINRERISVSNNLGVMRTFAIVNKWGPLGVKTIVGKEPGPTVSVLGGVHGNEPCGVNAFAELAETLPIVAGKVHFIIGNPRALEKNIRCTDTNLNRVFRDASELSFAQRNSYERKRAKEIIPYLLDSSVSLDLHSMTRENSAPFIYAEKNAQELAKQLPFNLVADGVDALQPGTTEYFMNTHGRKGITVECGQHSLESTTQNAMLALETFLKITGNMSGKTKIFDHETVHFFHVHWTQQKYTPTADFPNFATLKKREQIGIDGDLSLHAPQDCRILFGHIPITNPGEEAFILGQDAGWL